MAPPVPHACPKEPVPDPLVEAVLDELWVVRLELADDAADGRARRVTVEQRHPQGSPLSPARETSDAPAAGVLENARR